MGTHYILGHKYVSVRSSFPRIHSAMVQLSIDQFDHSHKKIKVYFDKDIQME